MKKAGIATVIVLIVISIVCLFFSVLHVKISIGLRSYQHEENRAADGKTGSTVISEDGVVDEASFVTHLPLVILDTKGEEIKNIYTFNEDSTIRDYADENVTNPWVEMEISIIDNENYENRITDEPTLKSGGLIKLRGASSRSFEKKQYGIKFLDETKGESKLSVLGMEADEDWVLSNSILDATGIRNYLAYNIGGQIFPFTPEARFCEVIRIENGTYKYYGLYLLTESVKKAKSRVDIADFNPDEKRLSYLICRDRQDNTSTTLSTWASMDQKCYGWFTFKYPKEELLTKEVVSRIEEDISTIEKILYSDNYQEFLTYSQYIDVDSFVDYFVVNEFFMNYDSGNNSTYYYQDYAHKLSMGPLWDYDNCYDNYIMQAGDAQYIVFASRPWFEKLIQDKNFVNLICERYEELRNTIFSTAYMESFIDDTVEYLGNAILRDRSRWREVYEENHMLHVGEEGMGYVIDRNRITYEEEILRLKDMMKSHGKWLDESMADFLSEYVVEEMEQKQEIDIFSASAAIFVFGFILMLMVIRQKNQG